MNSSPASWPVCAAGGQGSAAGTSVCGTAATAEGAGVTNPGINMAIQAIYEDSHSR